MSNILFILTGSIACYKACDAISQLVQRGHRVRAVATEAALRFVGVATLEGLTREKVHTDLFAAGEALEHIDLARWADVTVVCPATANTLNAMAAGLAADLAGALLLAHDGTKPLLVAPAMNPAMWRHPATVAAAEKLRGWGVKFIAPGKGRTACGELGEGRLAEPVEIVAALEAAGGAGAAAGEAAPVRAGRRVLVTSGGTAEPIDGVRVLTNTSTGETGALIAEQLARSGHEVTLLRARGSHAAPGGVHERTFVTFDDLDAALTHLLGTESFDAVIHAAAVSDFTIDGIEVDGTTQRAGEGKIASGTAPVLRLRRTPKLLDELRTRSRNRALRVVGFKLTNGASPVERDAAVAALLAPGGVDFVVANDLTDRTTDGRFPAEVRDATGAVIEHCPDRLSLAAALERVVRGERPARVATPTA